MFSLVLSRNWTISFVIICGHRVIFFFSLECSVVSNRWILYHWATTYDRVIKILFIYSFDVCGTRHDDFFFVSDMNHLYLLSLSLFFFLTCLDILSSHPKSLQSCPILCDLWTAVHQTPLSTGASRQEYWSVLPFPSPVAWVECYQFY